MAYLKFVDITAYDDPRKTKIWAIFATSGDLLGEIRFHAPWRKYIWRMQPNAIFDVGCTKEIVDFLTEHAGDRR